MSDRLFRLLLALGAALHALAWSAVLPPAQGPDEEEHFAYVQYLVEERRLPSYGGGFHVSEEWDRALVASGFDRIRWRPRERARPFAWPAADPEAARRPSDRPTFSGAPAQSPLYYAAAAVPYLALRDRSVVARLYGARAVGALLAAATALLAFAGLRAWTRGADGAADETAARLGALLVAVHPQAAFLFGVVNCDGLATLLWTATLAAAAPPRGGDRIGRCLLAGAAGGATYLAKSFGLSATAVAALLVAARVRRDGPRRAAALLGAFALGAALVVLPWVAWILHRPGGPVGLATGGPIGTESLLDLFRVTTPWTLFSQAWGVFGWLDAALPRSVRFGLALLCLYAFAGLFRRLRRGEPLRAEAAWAAAVLLHVACVLGVVGLFYLRSGFLVGLQGRYMLHPLAAWAGLLAAGLLAWSPAAVRSAHARVWSLGAVSFAVYALGVAAARYYG